MPAADSELEQRVWWERLDRAAKRRGREGQRIMGDWTQDTIAMLGVSEDHCLELAEGRWAKIPPERWTDEFKAQETRRLNDELGQRLGVGAYPEQ